MALHSARLRATEDVPSQLLEERIFEGMVFEQLSYVQNVPFVDGNKVAHFLPRMKIRRENATGWVTIDGAAVGGPLLFEPLWRSQA